MGVFLFIDGSALVCGWVNFPILWPRTPVQTTQVRYGKGPVLKIEQNL